MSALIEAAKEALDWLADQKLEACLIGALAVQRWGEPRATRDVDLTVFTDYGSEEAVTDRLLSRFAPRRVDTRAFALQYRVLLLRASNGVDLDVSLAALPFERECLARATPYSFEPEAALRTCSAEDLIIYKAVAGRPQDLLDIEGVLHRQFGKLALDRIRHWLGVFADIKEDPQMLARFEDLQRRAVETARHARRSD